eukprot:TRINITY_DN804_c0_g2_i5.p1 TRINITY_DN804_c0_g2~~TRINITY_DN804_c0_g2_i5.p1  ORF type:complete len:472 (-),score=80.38 TRINITY_DN804_c0_g2_i5:816-2231(-)
MADWWEVAEPPVAVETVADPLTAAAAIPLATDVVTLSIMTQIRTELILPFVERTRSYLQSQPKLLQSLESVLHLLSLVCDVDEVNERAVVKVLSRRREGLSRIREYCEVQKQTVGGTSHLPSLVVAIAAEALFQLLMTQWGEAIRLLDLAYIIGCPTSPFQQIVSRIESVHCSSVSLEPSLALVSHMKAISIDSGTSRYSSGIARLVHFYITLTSLVPTDLLPSLDLSRKVIGVNIEDLSAKSFVQKYCEKGVCAVVEGVQRGWNAPSRWSNAKHLLSSHGHRYVPVEIGTWSSGHWEEKCVSVRDFFEEYLVKEESVLYLAQHSLFDQLPSLRVDYSPPTLLTEIEGVVARDVNAWWGSANTITPLHYDSYHNFLAQVVGYKYVRLYHASESQYLYATPTPAISTKQQQNLSSITGLESEDVVERFPLLSHAKYEELLLGPGDTLFMPAGVWHYVRSLTTSMSINFWFTT